MSKTTMDPARIGITGPPHAPVYRMACGTNQKEWSDPGVDPFYIEPGCCFTKDRMAAVKHVEQLAPASEISFHPYCKA